MLISGDPAWCVLPMGPSVAASSRTARERQAGQRRRPTCARGQLRGRWRTGAGGGALGLSWRHTTRSVTGAVYRIDNAITAELTPPRARRSPAAWIAVVLASALLAGCGEPHPAAPSAGVRPPGAAATTAAPSVRPPTTALPTTAPPPDLGGVPCQGRMPPARYEHVVVV